MENTIIEFKNIKKSYKNTSVIEKFNLKIEKGNLVVLIGSSGSGKTTLLKMINRLIESTAGEILVNGKDIKKSRSNRIKTKHRICNSANWTFSTSYS